MSNRPSASGGGAGGDTDFRRTWDKAEYAAKAAAREVKIKEEGKARYEAALAGKKYIRRASTPPDAKETEARRSRLDVSAQIGKTVLVPAGSAVGKRGKGAGFYCESCDLTYKDNLQFVEHLNSRQHLVATGQTGEVRRATVEEVRERLEWLKRREEERARETLDLGTRLELAKEQEEREREEKRRKRNEKRRKTKGGTGEVKVEDVEDDGVIR